MTIEELGENFKSFELGMSQWLDRPVAGLLQGAMKDGLAYNKCSAGDIILAIAICIIPKDDKFRQSVKEFVVSRIGNLPAEPIENLNGRSLGDLIEADSIEAVTLREFESPYTVLIFTGNPRMAKELNDRFLSSINSGTLEYYV